MAGRRPEVEWSEPAEADLEGILGFIAVERPHIAQDVGLTLRNLAESLERLPLRGRVVPELRALGLSQFREVVTRPWRMIYRILGQKVIIVALLDGRRELQELLMERLIRHP